VGKLKAITPNELTPPLATKATGEAFKAEMKQYL